MLFFMMYWNRLELVLESRVSKRLVWFFKIYINNL